MGRALHVATTRISDRWACRQPCAAERGRARPGGTPGRPVATAPAGFTASTQYPMEVSLTIPAAASWLGRLAVAKSSPHVPSRYLQYCASLLTDLWHRRAGGRCGRLPSRALVDAPSAPLARRLLATACCAWPRSPCLAPRARPATHSTAAIEAWKPMGGCPDSSCAASLSAVISYVLAPWAYEMEHPQVSTELPLASARGAGRQGVALLPDCAPHDSLPGAAVVEALGS